MRSSRWRWALFLLLAILFHFLLMSRKVDWSHSPTAPRVEVQQVDPRKLEAIRKQWKRERSRNILIDKDPSRKKEAEAPRDARYFSDRNIRVEKEQRAKHMSALPAPRSQPKERHSKTLPSVGNLGVPLHLSRSKPPAPTQETPSGDQGVLERELPEGSENLLNAQESVFYSFYYRLYEAIAPVWHSYIRKTAPPNLLQPGDYSTTVEVIFDSEGNLVEVKTLRSSGIPAFDEAADRAWRRAPRFPNPPRGLLDPATGKVHTGWTFTVQVGQGFGLNYVPPSRNF